MAETYAVPIEQAPTLEKYKLAYTIAEAAQATGYSKSLIHRAVRENHLIQVTPPGVSRPVIRATDLQAWIDAGTES